MSEIPPRLQKRMLEMAAEMDACGIKLEIEGIAEGVIDKIIEDSRLAAARAARIETAARELPRECPTCAAKPGAPTLCEMCLAVRRLRDALREP